MAIDLKTLNNDSSSKVATKNNTLEGFLNKDISFGKKISDKEREVFYKDFSMLLSSGVDFKSAFGILISQQKNKYFKSILETLLDRVIKGKRLYHAMQEVECFSSYEFYSVKIGEETKKLNQVLLELHKFFKRKVKMRKQIISVITYPAFVFVITIGVLYFMLTYVVPMFKSIFVQFDGELPALTKKILFLSERAPQIFIVFLVLIIVLYGINFAFSDKDGYRDLISKILMKTPFFGRLSKAIHLARFCQFLDLLLSSKTPLTESLDLVRRTSKFYPIESSLESISREVTLGSSFASALEKHKVYEHKLVSMIKVAEEVNMLDTMFARLAEEYDDEVEYKSKMLGVVLEPLIIIFIGAMVGIIMIAMYAPMFDLSNVINK